MSLFWHLVFILLLLWSFIASSPAIVLVVMFCNDSNIFLSWQDTGELLMSTDIKKFQTYGGRKIVFEQEEVASMKKFDEPGRLMQVLLQVNTTT